MPDNHNFEYYATIYYRALRTIAAGGYEPYGPYPPGERHTENYIELSRDDMMKLAAEAAKSE